jgi:hypothetical protein
MRHSMTAVLALFAGTSLALGAPTPYALSETIELSATPVMGVDGQAASKGKIVRLDYPDGMGGFNVVLVSVYGDAQGPEVWKHDGSTHAAKDLFVTRSLDNGRTWSQPINVSNTANVSSMDADHDGDEGTAKLPYYGDSQKPNIFNNGKNVIISWVDHYVPSGVQGTVLYPESGNLEVPFAATYVVRSTDGGATWSAPERLSDGSRDAKQDVPKASSAGFVVTWQEDPKGLQPGDAEGPGEGGSGAKVSHGTDIWYSSVTTSNLGAGMPFSEPQRITDNFTRLDNDGDEAGQTGASRANLFVVGPTAIVAYEETKGLEGLDDGKYVRYHTFSAFNDSMPDVTDGAGWILSLPEESARRVRFIVQPGPLMNQSDVRIVWLYKQGDFDQGGPSDIMCRVGRKDPNDPASTGFRPEDLSPPIDPDATTRENAFNNDQGMNLSSSLGLDAHPEDDSFEDARAHRGILRGDFMAMGWSWTPDWAVARFTDLENYNFYMRTSEDGGQTWTSAVNMSNIDASEKVNVREPRIVGTPFSPNPATPADPGSFLVAWGTEVNQYEHVSEGIVDLDVFMTRTDDYGMTYAPVVKVAEEVSAVSDVGTFESQFRLDPDGNKLYAVWMEENRETGVVNAMFRVGSTCSVDFNVDGVLNFEDVSMFLELFGMQDPSADFVMDGHFNFLDVSTFLTEYAAGCP